MSMGRLKVEEKLFKALARVVQSVLFYPGISERLLNSAQMFLKDFADYKRPLRISLMGSDAVIEEVTVENPSPLEKLMVQRMRKAQWEGIRLEQGLTRDALIDMAMQLAKEEPPPIEGVGYKVGYLSLEAMRDNKFPFTKAAVGYLSLLTSTKSALDDLKDGGEEGLFKAKDIVESLAGQLAQGPGVFAPLRKLRHYDEYTFTHALNVGLVSMALGEALRVSPQALVDISLGALCHDLGKEKIPKDILNKPGKLDPDEKAVMDRHPLMGVKIVTAMTCDIPSIVPVLIYEHHMRNDGGYPSRLPGHFIHPASEIVAVADVFDALRTVRPYRRATDTEESITIMLGMARQGHLNRRILAVLAGVLGLVSPGRKVVLTDKRTAEVIGENFNNPFGCSVRTDDGERINLDDNPAVGINGFVSPEKEEPIQ